MKRLFSHSKTIVCSLYQTGHLVYEIPLSPLEKEIMKKEFLTIEVFNDETKKIVHKLESTFISNEHLATKNEHNPKLR